MTGSGERERERERERGGGGGDLMLRDELWYCTESRESWEIAFLCSLTM